MLETTLTSKGKLPDGLSTLQTLHTVRISARARSANISLEEQRPYLTKIRKYIYLDSILPLFYLPGMRAIELERIDEGLRKTWPAAPPEASALATLVLERCKQA